MIRKSTAIILAIVALVAGGIIGYYWGYDIGWERAMAEQANNLGANNNDRAGNDENPDQAPVQFQESETLGFFGTLTLKGYLELDEQDNVELARFVFDDPGNQAFTAFAQLNEGNSFLGGNKLALGCYQKNQDRIFYENFADTGNLEGEIRGADLTELLASDEDNKVELQVVREVYTSGRGAPVCYSHFRNFIVN